jgi:hypothetical protein
MSRVKHKDKISTCVCATSGSAIMMSWSAWATTLRRLRRLRAARGGGDIEGVAANRPNEDGDALQAVRDAAPGGELGGHDRVATVHAAIGTPTRRPTRGHRRCAGALRRCGRAHAAEDIHAICKRQKSRGASAHGVAHGRPRGELEPSAQTGAPPCVRPDAHRIATAPAAYPRGCARRASWSGRRRPTPQ